MKFIDNLLARSAGKATAIRPRPASLFEPLHGAAALLQAPPTVQAALHTEDVETDPPVPRRWANRREQPVERPRLESRTGRAADDAGEAQLSKIETRIDEKIPERDAVKSNRAIKPLVPEHEVTMAARRASEREEKAETTAPHGPHNSRLTADHVLSPQPPKAERDTASMVESRSLEPSAHRRTNEPKDDKTLLAGLQRNETQRVAPPSQLEDARISDWLRAGRHETGWRGPSFDSRQMGESVEPVIEVTIGRIEILAETAAEPARRREREKSPVMSLEEYLQRKSHRGNA